MDPCRRPRILGGASRREAWPGNCGDLGVGAAARRQRSSVDLATSSSSVVRRSRRVRKPARETGAAPTRVRAPTGARRRTACRAGWPAPCPAVALGEVQLTGRDRRRVDGSGHGPGRCPCARAARSMGAPRPIGNKSFNDLQDLAGSARRWLLPSDGGAPLTTRWFPRLVESWYVAARAQGQAKLRPPGAQPQYG